MRIGIGLPGAIPGAAGIAVEWARRADEGAFATLAAHDRLAYDSVDAVTALAAAAAVTRRIRLASLVAIGPLRGGPAMLAREANTLATLAGSPERLTLGLGLGPRREDYEAGGVPFDRRGRLLDSQLDGLRERLAAGIELVVGGSSDAALVRLVRRADGFCHGGGSPRAFRSAADRARVAWSDAGRPGRPRLWGLGYFALGAAAVEAGRRDLERYYAFTGTLASRIATGLLTTPAEIAEHCVGYAAAGCDELVLFPTVADLSQVDRLAEALLAGAA
jgi:alkanesulfonate monooxygenase SsuD/methylene tetrahydromethanopterin reductase-like flavin-dependent oxidoreductase (luciferase family)